MRQRAACALLAATALAPLPASAQQAYATMAAEILDPGTLQNNADMDFGDIIPSTTNGTVVMTASASAICTVTGGLVRTGPCKAAEFTGLAFQSVQLRVQRPNGDRIDLAGPGGATMRVENFSFGSTGTTADEGGNGANRFFRVNATDGSYGFHVGGTLRVGAAQAPGIYNGTFEIRINYN